MGVLDGSLRNKLVQMTRFRNLIVHGYVSVDLYRIYEILQTDVETLKTVTTHLIQSLTNLDEPSSS